MQQKSELYKALFGQNYNVETRLTIQNCGTFGEDTLISMSTDGGIFSNAYPTLACCVAGEISVTLFKPEAAIPRQARLVPEIRIHYNGQYSEWFQKGEFFIDTRKEDASGYGTPQLTIHGYDAMLKAEASYPPSERDWPAADIDVVRDIAAAMGVPVDSRTEKIIVNGYQIQYPAEYSQRETLGYIAAMYGGCFIISDTGELRLVQLGKPSLETALLVTSDERKSVTAGGKRIKVYLPPENIRSKVQSIDISPEFSDYTKVTFAVTDESEVTSGQDNGRVMTGECPWATEEVAANVLARLRTQRYQPYTATGARIDPASELGDAVLIGDVSGVMYTRSLTFGHIPVADISAPAEEVLDHEYPYQSSQERKVTRKLKQVSAELNIQAGQISAKVSKEGGDPKSFGWVLDEESWTLQSNNSTVLRADKDGLSVTGTIRASKGEIGGFTIWQDRLTTNGQNWLDNDAMDTGVYIGNNGIRLGKHFKVDSTGNLTAYSGTFTGTVHAGSIAYGGNAGTFSGSGLTGRSVTTTQTSGGINTSLGYADFSNGVFKGWNTAPQIKVTDLYVGDHQVKLGGLNYVSSDDEVHYIQVLTW